MQIIDKCNICGGKTKIIYELEYKDLLGMASEYKYSVGICPNCGFIYTYNPFDESILSNRYKNYSKFEFDDDDYFLSETDDYKFRSIRQHDFIDRVVGLNNINSILEIGASSGYNLSLYSEKETYGIEPSIINCKNALTNYNIDMFCGTFSEFMELNKMQKCYDLIFLSHTLEHIVNPCDFIRKCSEMNNKYIFIEVPTLDYKKVDEPFGMFCEEHVNIFTLDSLERLMKACGYSLVNADMIMGVEQTLPAGWPAISTLWQKSDNIKISEKILDSRNLLMNYIRKSEPELERIKIIIANIPSEKKLGIWGTGHFASMLLANTDLVHKEIVRIYDSDKRKSGLSFAGITVTEFSEEDIMAGKVDIVLIATYTAQKSIEKILRKYKEIVEIVALFTF